MFWHLILAILNITLILVGSVLAASDAQGGWLWLVIIPLLLIVSLLFYSKARTHSLVWIGVAVVIPLLASWGPTQSLFVIGPTLFEKLTGQSPYAYFRASQTWERVCLFSTEGHGPLAQELVGEDFDLYANPMIKGGPERFHVVFLDSRGPVIQEEWALGELRDGELGQCYSRKDQLFNQFTPQEKTP